MVIASSFVLLVSIWLNVMTAYVTAMRSFVADKDGNILRLVRFQPAIYTIHNGAILENGQDETIISVLWSRWRDDPEQEVLDNDDSYGYAGVTV